MAQLENQHHTEGRVAFFTVVYPGVEPYLPCFVESILAQTCKNFSLFVFNDGVADETVESYFGVLSGYVEWRSERVSGTPAQIRINAINRLNRYRYQYAIFGDSDDYFSANRVACVLELFRYYDVVINDLHIVNVEGSELVSGFLSKRLMNLQDIDQRFLRDKNICGFSNASLNLEKFGRLEIDDDVLATDWYLFTLAVLKGLRMVFSSDAATYYRQHDANYVGIGNVTTKILNQTVLIKSRHYTQLARHFPGYLPLAQKYQNLLSEVDNSQDNLMARFLKHHQRDDHLFWWEAI